MKTYVFLWCCFLGLNVFSQNEDDVLFKTSEKIAKVLTLAYVNHDDKALKDIILKLKNQSKDKNRIAIYWLGYAQYYDAVYLASTGNKEEKEEAENTLKTTIEMLEDQLPNKNAEEHALVAMIETFYISFAPPMKKGFLSNKVHERLNIAEKLDSKNLRVNLAAGEMDYYTPEIFGGKRKCENYFKKAIAAPDQEEPNPYTPSWGKPRAYELLIKFYIETHQKANYKHYFEEAISKYPNDHQIRILTERVSD